VLVEIVCHDAGKAERIVSENGRFYDAALFQVTVHCTVVVNIKVRKG